jgi:hypothetical protein
MTPKPDPLPAKTRRRLLAAGWVLLALSLLISLGGPWLMQSRMPADIGNRMGDVEWSGIGWVIVGMIVGALALMCFVAQWVLRPGGEDGAPPRGHPQGK